MFFRKCRYLRALIDALQPVYSVVRAPVEVLISFYKHVVYFITTSSLAATILTFATPYPPRSVDRVTLIIDGAVNIFCERVSDPVSLFWHLFDLGSEFVSGYDWLGLLRSIAAADHHDVKRFIVVFTEASIHLSTKLPLLLESLIKKQLAFLSDLIDLLPPTIRWLDPFKFYIVNQPGLGINWLNKLLKLGLKDLLPGVESRVLYNFLIFLRGTLSSFLQALLAIHMFAAILSIMWTYLLILELLKLVWLLIYILPPEYAYLASLYLMLVEAGDFLSFLVPATLLQLTILVGLLHALLRYFRQFRKWLRVKLMALWRYLVRLFFR